MPSIYANSFRAKVLLNNLIYFIFSICKKGSFGGEVVWLFLNRVLLIDIKLLPPKLKKIEVLVIVFSLKFVRSNITLLKLDMEQMPLVVLFVNLHFVTMKLQLTAVLKASKKVD